MKIVFVDDLGTTPAKVHRPTGTIYWSRKYNYLPMAQKVFIIMHEIGHYKLQTKNEFEADNYAFNRVAGKFPESLKNSVYAMTDVFNFSTTEQKQRVIEQLKRAFMFDYKHNNNLKALNYLKILNGENNMDLNELTEHEAIEVVKNLNAMQPVYTGVKKLVTEYLPELTIDIKSEIENYSSEDELEFSNFQTEKAVLINDLRDPSAFQIFVADFSGFDRDDIFSNYNNYLQYLNYLENVGVMDDPFSEFSLKRVANHMKTKTIPNLGKIIKVGLPIATGTALASTGIGAGIGAKLIGKKVLGITAKILQNNSNKTKPAILTRLKNLVETVKNRVNPSVQTQVTQTTTPVIKVAETVNTQQVTTEAQSNSNNTAVAAEQTSSDNTDMAAVQSGSDNTANEATAQIQSTNQTMGNTSKPKSNKTLFIVLALVVLAVAGYFAYKHYNK